MKILSCLFLVFYCCICTAQIKNSKKLPFPWQTDTTKSLTQTTEFEVLLKRGEIPPIDAPKFITKKEAFSIYFKNEPVILIEQDGKSRAYPLNILMYHEVINDTFLTAPILVSYNALTNSPKIFSRKTNFDGGRVLQFSTSGIIRKSNLLLWDIETQTWWQQFNGKAMLGKYMGLRLKEIPSQIMDIATYFDLYPNGLVLSPKTGHAEISTNYGFNSYINYDDIQTKQPKLFYEKLDTTLNPMERCVGLTLNYTSYLIPYRLIKDSSIVHLENKTEHIILVYIPNATSILDNENIRMGKKTGSALAYETTVDGKALHFKKTNKGLVDLESESIWDLKGVCMEGLYVGKKLSKKEHTHCFAFAWMAFNPYSRIRTK